jgi:GNAT superfamily N-acetyltransferase
MSEFRISTNRAELDVPRIHQFLSEDSYWLKGASRATVEKAIANSLCFGGFVGGTQVAFGRAVTDLAMFAYLRDIFVFQEHRSKGYGRALVQAMMERLKGEGVSSIMLATKDAHGLYEKFGFSLIGNSPKLMAYDRLPRNPSTTRERT